MDKQGFDSTDIELIEKSIDLEILIIKIKTEEKLKILKDSEEWSYEFEEIAKFIVKCIGKERFKKALIHLGNFEGSEIK